jgi:hypothetical protein
VWRSAGALRHNCIGGQIRVLPGQEGPQTISENDLFKRPIELDAMDVVISETLQPLDGRKLELGFAAPVRHEAVGYPEWLTSIGLPVARA